MQRVIERYSTATVVIPGHGAPGGQEPGAARPYARPHRERSRKGECPFELDLLRHSTAQHKRPSASLQGYAKRHYTGEDIEKLGAQSNIDIVLTHDAPAGVRFDQHRRGVGFVSEAAGLEQLLSVVVGHLVDHATVCANMSQWP